jgi:hypothetical protein
MRVITVVVFLVGLIGCGSAGDTGSELDSAKNNLDTLVNRAENSAIVDSIKSKGGVILDSVKSKGGRLIKKTDVRINNPKKDSTN